MLGRKIKQVKETQTEETEEKKKKGEERSGTGGSWRWRGTAESFEEVSPGGDLNEVREQSKKIPRDGAFQAGAGEANMLSMFQKH